MTSAPAAQARAQAAPPARAYRRLGVEERRSQLLAAALTLFAHRAPDEVSIDEVAAVAGVSRPLVYRYFPGGRQQLYEAALGSAAEQLTLCFAEPAAGPPTERVSRVLDRYLGFVDQHDAGFSALLRGGSVVETSRTSAIVDGVRRAAAEQILLHLGRGAGPGQRQAGPRLRMMVRTWIAAVEAASLIWLDEGKQPSAPELRGWLVDHLVALLAATAASDSETAGVVADLLAQESADGPAARLAAGMLPVASHAAHLLPPA
ncbi:TetR/AcrR family transcriptional regulator [Streptomyces nitrosporeus]|uniref:TetR/AcrR family transcriptional regulator n=1 Tax=Streptomyces nitrosporeus TaxID=28894 RepID=A0A5J6FBK4_9ACTN|nr:TetR/AcrR family transcriptional regulator [Streptomyces nitrosporeus]QEU72360.1 TetR/AcrR family transcriptional regulator [Streptomyces nitrosporeus]GGY78547.1 TetR family transcriptional regulator [Streptomyces nitrosporeus]